MYKIIVDRECGCFKRSDMQNNLEIESKDEALAKSLEMKNEMNDVFCKKHSFSVQEGENCFIISMNS
ncbi:hypothetical protein GJV85_01405 [Sulfurimonas aquatica]|uniref:Uncharacterized protein n=1 Tax=Sulfurimonas aquatica TaxID=2672570 RepID=A0A975AYH8_9BACT|nr:hypothetical protein [Sulfurimonas aquatica]QSZ40825.1 hypothetical protein GJV85_01405 [Sulfurimonas aquatica]